MKTGLRITLSVFIGIVLCTGALSLSRDLRVNLSIYSEWFVLFALILITHEYLRFRDRVS